MLQKCYQRKSTQLLTFTLLFGFSTILYFSLYLSNVRHNSLEVNAKRPNVVQSSYGQSELEHVSDSHAYHFDTENIIHHKFHLGSKKESQSLRAQLSELRSQLEELSAQLDSNHNSSLEKSNSEDSKEKYPILFETKERDQVPAKVESRSTNDIAPDLPDLMIPRFLNGSFVPKHYHFDKHAFLKYQDYLKKTEELLPPQTKAVIILTNHRSGSSFFGELFNQHPDAFYFFEPLFPLSTSDNCYNPKLKIDAIRKLSQCELTKWRDIYPALPPSMRPPKNLNMVRCLVKNICFRLNTKELCEAEHCPRSKLVSDVKNGPECFNKCGVVNPLLAMNTCRRKKIVAMKVIRLCDILTMDNLFQTSNVDLKIIHLIRDPRGIANSRQMISRKLDVQASLKMTCGRQIHNIHSGVTNTPDWLKGRYKLFRYEDIATSPYAVAQSVYDFVGLDFPDVMKYWISNNTNIDDVQGSTETPTTAVIRSKRDVVFDAKNRIAQMKLAAASKAKNSMRGPYGTRRNSTAIVQKWAKRLPYTVVRQVEDVCKEVMDVMGYMRIGTPEEYGSKDPQAKYFTADIPILHNIEQDKV